MSKVKPFIRGFAVVMALAIVIGVLNAHHYWNYWLLLLATGGATLVGLLVMSHDYDAAADQQERGPREPPSKQVGRATKA